MEDKKDQLILDIKIANYRKMKQQKIEEEQYFQQQLPKIKEQKYEIFYDDMHYFTKQLFTGLPFALGSMMVFRSLIVFPIAIMATSAIQSNIHKFIE